MGERTRDQARELVKDAQSRLAPGACHLYSLEWAGFLPCCTTSVAATEAWIRGRAV